MSRFRIGSGLLILLLGVCVFSWVRMEKIQKPIAELICRAEEHASRGEWTRASTAVAVAKRAWEKHRTFVAALADHQPLEDIECLFAMLCSYASQREQTEFRAACQELNRRILAVKEAQECGLGSLF